MVESSVTNYVALSEKKPEDPVARSIAKRDAFAKPGHVTRVRLTNEKPTMRRRKKKRDPRDVIFY